jgi:hypothetical protein
MWKKLYGVPNKGRMYPTVLPTDGPRKFIASSRQGISSALGVAFIHIGISIIRGGVFNG